MLFRSRGHAHGAGRSHTDTRRTRCVAADPSQSVEQFAQKALAAALMFPLVAVLPAMTAIFGYSKTNAAQRPRAVVSDAALDDLVEFAAIEPDQIGRAACRERVCQYG